MELLEIVDEIGSCGVSPLLYIGLGGSSMLHQPTFAPRGSLVTNMEEIRGESHQIRTFLRPRMRGTVIRYSHGP
jgi:hypothetical protein